VQEKIQINGIDVFIEGPSKQLRDDSQPPATIVMIHGWPDTYRLWDDQVAALSSTYRCVRFTLPGFDVSGPKRRVSLDEMIELFATIVDKVSPDKAVTLMLHDWGCVFGYQYAAKHANRVERIIGVDIGDTFDPDFPKRLGFKAKAMVTTYQLWLAAAYPLGGVGTRMTRLMAKALKAPAPSETLGAQQNYPYVMQWRGGFRDAVNFVPNCPFLYFYGERKPFMFHSTRWLHTVAATPHSKVIALATGHWVMKERSSEFNTHVLSWLQSSSS
jgi:cis-3-alkyl-4-acyloxetan-2-one decarboxylase